MYVFKTSGNLQLVITELVLEILGIMTVLRLNFDDCMLDYGVVIFVPISSRLDYIMLYLQDSGCNALHALNMKNGSIFMAYKFFIIITWYIFSGYVQCKQFLHFEFCYTQLTPNGT